MSPSNQIGTVGALLSYALEIEREAAARYLELADIMETHNNTELAAFLRRMSRVEQLHVDRLETMQGAAPANGAPWEDIGGREAVDWGELHYLQRPRHAIEIALRFERRAAEFFRELAQTAVSESVQAMAARLAGEEDEHIRELIELLSRYPPPAQDWDWDSDPPADQE